jgi:hypothetical protein
MSMVGIRSFLKKCAGASGTLSVRKDLSSSFPQDLRKTPAYLTSERKWRPAFQPPSRFTENKIDGNERRTK